MDEKKLKSDEYEKQYYGFSSTDFYEDFKEQVCKSIKMALKELDTALKEQQYDEVLRDQIIEIYSLYMKNAQAALERAKEEAAKIFAIPNNVVLDEDKYSINQYSDEDVIQLKKEVAELEKEFMRERVFLAKCKQQKDIIETIIKPLHEKVNDIIKSLKKLPEHAEVNENDKKLLDLHEEYIRYYFSSPAIKSDQPELLEVQRVFVQSSPDIFKL